MKKTTFAICISMSVMIGVVLGATTWIQAQSSGEKLIRFATVAWEPYYGPNLKDKGYVTEITRQALKRVGYDMTVRFVPWKRALHDAKNGYYNGVLGLYYSEERAAWLAYTEPIASVQLVFFMRKDRWEKEKIMWKTLEDLKPYTIGVEREYVYTEEFDSADYLKKEPVRKIEINFKKLMGGRVDLVAASRNVFLHWVKTHHPDKLDQIVAIPHPLTENRIYNGFPKKDPKHMEYVADFNKGFQMIKADGTFDDILQDHGFK